jgi:glycosyltransferase involved in cell wall biosynthesis
LLVSLSKIIQRERPDVIHVNSSKLAGLGAFACFFHNVFWKLGIINWKINCVFTAHGWPFNEDRNFLARGLIYFFSWLTSFFANITITISQKDFEQGKRMPLVGHRMRLIHNGIEKIDFYSRELARTKLGLPQEEHVVGVIAELTPNKGLEYLAAAAANIPNVNFVVIGEGELFEKLKSTRLKLLGFVPEANRYLKAFGIFVLPSLKEGLPYVLLEAGQAGLPVVASNVGGIPEIVGNAGMLVPPKNTELLARAINALKSNKQLRTNLGFQLRDQVSKSFSLESFLTKTYALYEN